MKIPSNENSANEISSNTKHKLHATDHKLQDAKHKLHATDHKLQDTKQKLQAADLKL